ncbi:hypothetical protein K8352_18115 [Flavobacteriaceae bacterium F89]|uniref:Uncharacterized protein n=1 Tax=Cerina litoralis TaxID=2874477 RepID=A0AAE3EXF5_9FLAO|nr:hypothetical protein [Cerina litoralis]MCG2462683.1 hypothetical protein [Cerina litoralis]
MKTEKLKLGLAILILLLAAVGPNLFPIAQAGIANLSKMAVAYLIPSVVLIFVLVLASHMLKFTTLKRQIITGIIAGITGTVGLEIFRIIGFRIGWMPGDLPKLMGVLLLDQFALGPNTTSNIAGWAYHFWNGAAFGIIFSVLVGRGKIWIGALYGFLVGIGFMLGPVVKSLGIGAFGFQFKDGYQFFIVVSVAHIAFGAVLGWLVYKMNSGVPNIFVRIKESYIKGTN